MSHRKIILFLLFSTNALNCSCAGTLRIILRRKRRSKNRCRRGCEVNINRTDRRIITTHLLLPLIMEKGLSWKATNMRGCNVEWKKLLIPEGFSRFEVLREFFLMDFLKPKNISNFSSSSLFIKTSHTNDCCCWWAKK